MTANTTISSHVADLLKTRKAEMWTMYTETLDRLAVADHEPTTAEIEDVTELALRLGRSGDIDSDLSLRRQLHQLELALLDVADEAVLQAAIVEARRVERAAGESLLEAQAESQRASAAVTSAVSQLSVRSAHLREIASLRSRWQNRINVNPNA